MGEGEGRGRGRREEKEEEEEEKENEKKKNTGQEVPQNWILNFCTSIQVLNNERNGKTPAGPM